MKYTFPYQHEGMPEHGIIQEHLFHFKFAFHRAEPSGIGMP